MRLRTRLKLVFFLLIATILIGLVIVFVPAPAKRAIPGLTILDSKLKVYDCFVSYGPIHYTVQHPLLTETREKIWAMNNRLFHSPIPLHFGVMLAPTGTNAVALVFNLAWDFSSTNFSAASASTNFPVYMTDAAGRFYPTHFELQAGGATSNVFYASIIRSVQCPTPPPPGDYEFQILLCSNGPAIAKYKTTLNLR